MSSQDPGALTDLVIAVVDGMGGGIGAQIVAQLRQELPLEIEILALGTNAVVTQKMMQARASRGASGENAIRVSIGSSPQPGNSLTLEAATRAST